MFISHVGYFPCMFDDVVESNRWRPRRWWSEKAPLLLGLLLIYCALFLRWNIATELMKSVFWLAFFIHHCSVYSGAIILCFILLYMALWLKFLRSSRVRIPRAQSTAAATWEGVNKKKTYCLLYSDTVKVAVGNKTANGWMKGAGIFRNMPHGEH